MEEGNAKEALNHPPALTSMEPRRSTTPPRRRVRAIARVVKSVQWLLDEGLCLYGTDLGLFGAVRSHPSSGGGR